MELKEIVPKEGVSLDNGNILICDIDTYVAHSRLNDSGSLTQDSVGLVERVDKWHKGTCLFGL